MKRRWVVVFALMAGLWPLWVMAQEDEGAAPTVSLNEHVAMWSAIVGFFLPAAIAMINRQHWKSWAKAVCAFVVSLIAAAGTAWFSGDINETSDVMTAALFVFSMAVGTYQFWWKPSGIAPAIEAATG